MSITLVYPGTIKKFIDACKIANDILSSEQFFKEIAAKKTPYDQSVPTDLAPEKIAELFQKSSLILKLKEYSAGKRKGGKFYPSDPQHLYVNTRTNRSGCTYASVLVHESVHALSFHTPEYDFTHKDNNSSTSQGTAPYAIQNMVRRIFCGEPIDIIDDYIEVDIYEGTPKEEKGENEA